MEKSNILTKIKNEDITSINLDTVFLHYTNISNLNGIMEKGLEPKIGKNSKLVEKSEKVFFSMGDKGALVIMDVWLKLLIAKPINTYIYWFGAWLLRFKYFPKVFHKTIIKNNQNSMKKKQWAFRKLKTILDNSVYLILDLKENEDFSFNDIDEAKQLFRASSKYVDSIYACDSDFNDPKIEYWNMHTFSNKVIDKNKISLLKINDQFSSNEIIKYLANKNKAYVENNCKLLNEYLTFLDNC